MCEKIWSNCPIFNFKIAKVLKKVLKFLLTYLVKIGKKSWHYLYENVCAEADLTSIVINQEGVDVVRWSVFHEPRSPDLDDEQVSRNQEQCGPKTIQHKPTIDPFISQIPQAIRPLIKVSRNVHSIFHHVPQIRSTCSLWLISSFLSCQASGNLIFWPESAKNWDSVPAFRPWMSDNGTKLLKISWVETSRSGQFSQ